MLRRLMLCAMLVLMAGLTANAVEVAFELVDEATVMGAETMRWRPLRLADQAPEGLAATVPLAGEARYGTLCLGVGEGAKVAVLLDYSAAAPALYLDIDADRQLDAAEACSPLEPGLWQVSLVPPGEEVARTVQFKLAAGGRMIMYAVRGCRSGALPTPEGVRPVLLLDENGDCAYNTGGQDQLCCDLNGDGRFDPASERVALRRSVRVGEQEWSVEVTPTGDALTIDERNRQTGQLLTTIALREGEVAGALLTLVRDDGLPVAVREVGAPVELAEGTYRLAGADLRARDAAGVEWRYPFSGSAGRIVVRPGELTETAVLAPVACDLSIDGTVAPGQTISVTVMMRSVEGLILGPATRGGQTVAARARLLDPQGRVAASADAGFG